MTYAFFGFIGKPYCDISGVINNWARESEQLLVYEHGPDDGASYTHCHILVMGIKLDKKQLYKRKDWKELGLDGKKKQFGFDTFQSGKKTIEYMSKGMYDPVFNKGFDSETIANAKANGYVRTVNDNDNDNKVNYYRICKKIKHSVSYVPCLMRDDFGNMISGQRIASFDEVYDKLLKELDENEVRTNGFDMERWLLTILRDDPHWGVNYRENLRKKFLPA